MTATAVASRPQPMTPPGLETLDRARYVVHTEKGHTYLEHRASRALFWYDAARAEQVVRFFATRLKLQKGDFYGRPFILQQHQADDWIRPMFGWKRVIAGEPPHRWPRRFRRGRKWVPRKNGKTEELAGVGIVLTAEDAEPGADVYSIAKDKSQASIVFRAAQAIAAQDADLVRRLEFLKTATYCTDLNARMMPLSGKPEGKHGLNPHACLGDEVHEWLSMDLHTFIVQGMGARRQPLDVTISTAGIINTVGHKFYQESKQALEGDIDDPATLVVAYEAHADDDWQDPRTWAKANPNLGVSISMDYLRDAAMMARQYPRLENDFKRYHLNIWTEQDTRWLPMEDWRACTRTEPGDILRWQRLFDELRGRACYGGLDLASTRDLCALCWYFPAIDDEPAVFIWRFWCPGDTVHMRTKQDKVPYEQWTQLGSENSDLPTAIEATPGNVTDYDYIRNAINEDRARFDVQGLGVDKYNASQLTIDLMGDGAPIKFYPQSFLGMSPPSKALEIMVVGRKFDHASHPVARWMASNCGKDEDANGNIKPSKVKSKEKIDGIAAQVIAIGMSMGVEEVGHPNVEAMPE